MIKRAQPFTATGVLLSVAIGAQARADTDYVQLADSASESTHNVTAVNTRTGTGALDLRARWFDQDGIVTFDIDVDGTTQNYITTRMWGGVTGHQGRFYIGDADGNAFAWNLVDEPTTSGIAPDRWYYATIPIPVALTNGQSSVRLSLYAADNTAGTRAAYTIFSHTDTRFTVPDGVAQNPAVTPYDYGDYTAPSTAARAAEHNRLVGLANNLAHQVANMQVLDTTGLPSALLGAFDIRTGSDDQATLDATHRYYINRDNLGPLRGANVLAYAYHMAGTDFYQSADTLNRIALGIDFTRRAQGSSGGYVDVWSPVQWVGGPNRAVGTGALEGITHDDIANAFLMTRQAMESAGLLDQLIDDDNNAATAMIARRQAYIDLFKGFVDFHTGYFSDGTIQEPGHAPNQEVYQLRGLITAYRALEALDPTAVDEATFAPIVVARANAAFGLADSYFNGTPWFSPQGLPLEAGGLLGGGYSSEYGHGVAAEMFPVIDAIGDLATPAEREALLARATQAASIWQHFVYPVYHEDGSFDLRLEGANNWRNLKSNGLQDISWAPFMVAALDRGDPGAQRLLQLLAMNGSLSYDTIDNGHYWQQGVWTMEQVAEIGRVLSELPATSLRLPHEAGQPDYAFVDAVGGAVAIKYDGRHIFMALNWHHGSLNGEPITNDIARVHEVTPLDDRIATILMENPHGFGELALVEYDDLLVAANASDVNSYEVFVGDKLHRVLDLVSGDIVRLHQGYYTLEAGQSAVFVLHAPEPGVAGVMGVACLSLMLRRNRPGRGAGGKIRGRRQ